MPFAIPVDVSLLQYIGVGGCGCSSYCNVSLMILEYFSFRNSALISASDASATTNLSTQHGVNISSLRSMGSLSCGFHLWKKFTAFCILVSLADKSDTS